MYEHVIVSVTGKGFCETFSPACIAHSNFRIRLIEKRTMKWTTEHIEVMGGEQKIPQTDSICQQ